MATKESNGWSHATTTIGIVVAALGLVAGFGFNIIGGINKNISDLENSLEKRISDVQTTSLSLREHQEYKTGQEAFSHENREAILRIGERLTEVRVEGARLDERIAALARECTASK